MNLSSLNFMNDITLFLALYLYFFKTGKSWLLKRVCSSQELGFWVILYVQTNVRKVRNIRKSSRELLGQIVRSSRTLKMRTIWKLYIVIEMPTAFFVAEIKTKAGSGHYLHLTPQYNRIKCRITPPKRIDPRGVNSGFLLQCFLEI